MQREIFAFFVFTHLKGLSIRFDEYMSKPKEVLNELLTKII